MTSGLKQNGSSGWLILEICGDSDTGDFPVARSNQASSFKPCNFIFQIE
jgi:hypothetical protein